MKLDFAPLHIHLSTQSCASTAECKGLIAQQPRHSMGSIRLGRRESLISHWLKTQWLKSSALPVQNNRSNGLLKQQVISVGRKPNHLIVFLLPSKPKRHKEIKCTHEKKTWKQKWLAGKERFKEGWQRHDAQCINTRAKLEEKSIYKQQTLSVDYWAVEVGYVEIL